MPLARAQTWRSSRSIVRRGAAPRCCHGQWWDRTAESAKCIHVRITWYRSHPLRDIRVCREADIRWFFEPTAANSDIPSQNVQDCNPRSLARRLQVSMLLAISANFRGFSRWRELCSFCNRHHTVQRTRATGPQSGMWRVRLHRDSVRRHASSDQHAVATELEKTRVAAADDGGLPQAFEEQVSMFCKSRPRPTAASMPRCWQFLGKALLKKAAQDTTSLHQFCGHGPLKKITCRDTAQPAEEAAADEESSFSLWRILLVLSVRQSVEWTLLVLAVQC